MKVAIMGSGGVGGYYGGRLAKAGEGVTFIARGPHLAALRIKGLRVKSHFGDFDLPSVNATDDSASIGPVDLVIVATKAYGLDAAAEAMLPLMGDATTVLPLLNGVDIGERLGAVLGTERIMPGLCNLSTFIAEPGVIHQVTPFEYLKFGETSGEASERGKTILTVMKSAEINAELSADITVELWNKFLMLAAAAGLTSVSRSPMGLVRSDPDLRVMLAAQIGETEALGRAKGVNLAPDVAERILAQIDGVPAEAKPSMFMDLEAGRPLELEVLQGTIIKMGTELGIEIPVARFIHAAPQAPCRRRTGRVTNLAFGRLRCLPGLPGAHTPHPTVPRCGGHDVRRHAPYPHRSSTARTAAASRVSMRRPQRSLIAIHNRTYSQRNSGFGGSHAAGSFAPLDRFAEADTAIKVLGSDRSLAYCFRCAGAQAVPPLR